MAHGAHHHGHHHQHDHGAAAAEGPSFAAPRPGDRARIEAVWPFVRDSLPAAPGSVLEIGCGALGGFVPRLLAEGYHAVGVDPEAPEEPGFVRDRYEDYRPEEADLPFDAVVACLSLHHVEDLDALLAKLAEQVRPGGRLVLREWAREEFDEATARWCFDRLPRPRTEQGAPQETEQEAEESPGWWLARHREGWREAGGDWEPYFQGWAVEHGLMTGAAMLRALEASAFETVLLERDPYFHTALADVTEAEERAAVEAGAIRANGLRYVGRRKS